MTWNAPLSAQALLAALHYAWDSGRLARASGATINCSVDLEPTAKELCGAISLVDGDDRQDIIIRKHVWNGRPKDWWTLGFLFRES